MAGDSRIRTSFVNPPIPIRHFDWVAWLDGEEENGFCGHGRNESEAVFELQNLLAEHDDSPPLVMLRSCNLHNDCEADERSAGHVLIHCHVEDCEDCFGC